MCDGYIDRYLLMLTKKLTRNLYQNPQKLEDKEQNSDMTNNSTGVTFKSRIL